MSIQTGDSLPAGSFKTMDDGQIRVVSTDELFGGKTVVLFGVPGAFTPTCNDAHMPGYMVNADALREKGVDTVACMAVNDVFVMGAWGRANDTGDYIQLLADGNGDYAQALGLTVDLSGFGMGQRVKRFALVAKDGEVTYLGVEPGGEVTVSGADAVLEHL
ncbi:MAG: peroxiredoxin [Acidobacteriota bacterium]